ncbi:hypothetical protein EE612_005412 [Oryza sativa]|nr:hypothetical protein EE612_005412 [Oryza sativa]
MDTFFSAVLGDLLSRSISFMVDSYYQKHQGVEENLQCLHRLLLRIQAIVEEADSRHITNQAMLLQLRMLSNMMYRGYYFLDNFRCRIVQAHAQDEVRDHSLALSSFNPLKQFCFSTTTRKMVSEVSERKELHKMLGHLESIVSDMQEFVVFVSSYPRMSRQPYCSYLLLENCMFGRQEEQERVINFLLARHPPGGEEVIDVLPIIGPGRVGKSTLVEHVCHDERVRKYFSTIVFYGLGSIENNGDMAFLPDTGAVKYRNPVSGKQSLAIIELVDEMDDETWKKILHSLRGDHIAPVSKIIIMSRSNKIELFGTTKALQLDFLPKEVFWYFFKTIAFGSTSPVEEPKLASICMDIAASVNRSFIGLNVHGSILRSNICAQFWYSYLKRLKYYTDKHVRLFGEHPRDTNKNNGGLTYVWMHKNKHGCSGLATYKLYQASSISQNNLPTIRSIDMVSRNVKPRAKYEVLEWQSSIPPYYSYIAQYEILAQPKLMLPPKRKRSGALSEELV